MNLANKRVAINTGGGDAPGLNAVIRAATLAGIRRNWEMFGIRNGYRSLTEEGEAPLMTLDQTAVQGITMRGGTILGTANRGNPFEMPIKNEKGEWELRDESNHLVEQFKKQKLDALIAIGGDGSMHIASKLIEKGIPIVGVPKTIDNDLPETDITLGFDTALSTATESIDKITTTAEAHERIMVVEVMGRYAGWIALNSGLSSTADVILIPEIPFDFDSIVDKIKERQKRGRNFTMIVVAEGAVEKNGKRHIIGKAVGQAEQLGGVGEFVSKRLNELTGQESRHVVLGHLQRGGSPSSTDRLLSIRLGAEAIRAVNDGDFNKLIVTNGPDLKRIPISDIAGKTKTVPLDGDVIQTARDIGICLGD